MTGNQFQIAVSVLFPTYVLFELPSNLVLKHYVRPSRWIAFITTSWGLIATLSGLTQSYAGLLACRVLLGLFEAGLFPGCVVSVEACPPSLTLLAMGSLRMKQSHAICTQPGNKEHRGHAPLYPGCG